MQKQFGYAVASALFLFSLTAAAELVASNKTQGFFAGLGGSYNSVNFQQNLYLLGNLNVFIGGVRVATGSTQGPGASFDSNVSTFAPAVQAGYFQHFTNSDWLWGMKFAYQYLGATASEGPQAVDRVGVLTTLVGVDTYTGHAVIDSVQTSINSELMLLPFFGRSLGNTFVYFGAGPALFSTQSNYSGVNGYANVNGVTLDVTGNSQSFSNSNWMWGGAFQVGMAYNFDSTWFIDFNYTYAVTATTTSNYSTRFSSQTAVLSTSGTLSGTSSQQIGVQGMMVSINKVF